jgi:ubiquinone/menaquinone biosynthesis C-methylase UbiE
MEEVRKSHNLVKRHLIQKVIGKSKSIIHVLDVGCGCGGDLKKWYDLNVPLNLDICDPDQNSLNEVRQRIKNLNLTDKKIRIYHGDITACPDKKYDYICYNFSLHYIFKNAGLFFRTLNEIKKRLKVGGKLFGCIPDSEKILMKTPFNDVLGNYIARNEESTGNGNFGETIFVYLSDTPYYNDGPKAEPIAYKDLLITHLELNGIYMSEWIPIKTNWDISNLYSQFIFVRL